MVKYHILKEYANGVIDEKNRFYPYKVANADVSSKAGIRYFIRSITLASSQSGAVATCIDKVEVTCGRTTVVLAQNNIPATFVASNDCVTVYNEPRCLTDIGSDINVTIASVAGLAIVQYAEITEQEGEYGQ